MRFLRAKPIVAIFFCTGTLAILPPCVAHSCAFQDMATVHFNTFRPDFGTPVRRTPRGYWDNDLWSAADDGETGDWRHLNPERRYAASDSARAPGPPYWYNSDEHLADLEAKTGKLYVQANKQIQAGLWSLARQTYLAIVRIKGRWSGDLRDRVDLLGAITSGRSFTSAELSAAKHYFDAIEQVRKWPVASDALRHVANSLGGAFLKDRVSYKYACISYERKDSDAALKLFIQFAASYPHSPKREDALIMIARICILQDAPDPKTIETGLAAIRQLLASYPHTRFYMSAFGLQARVHFLQHQYSDALWCYFRLGDIESAHLVCDAMPRGTVGTSIVRLLDAYLQRINDVPAGDVDSEVDAVRQVNHLRNQLSLDMIREFQHDLKSSPSLLASYIYYRLYYTNTRVQDQVNLAYLARAILAHNQANSINPAVAVRLAEVEYQQGHFKQCIAWASRALQANQSTRNSRDRALFIRASGEAKSNRLAAAQKDLLAVLQLSTDNPIRQSTRELLALTCERSGELGLALDQYFELGYNLDSAYLLDVRMNTNQIEAYLRHCKDVKLTKTIYRNVEPQPIVVTYKRSQLLEYTLGIHFLRLERWDAARRWLSLVPQSVLHQFDLGRRDFGSNPSPNASTAVSDLAALESAVHHARGYEAKAAAAYRYASYYHTHGALLLYNAMLWDGSRVYSFEEGWNTNCQTSADTSALRDYFAGHENYLRSRELCLAVVKRYPRSRVAPQALYRAACASERAGALAGWYEGQNKSFRYTPSGEAGTLMRRLVNLYPHSPLVSNARKYAAVFAVEARPAGWPRYAVSVNGGSPYREASGAVDDAENLAAQSL